MDTRNRKNSTKKRTKEAANLNADMTTTELPSTSIDETSTPNTGNLQTEPVKHGDFQQHVLSSLDKILSGQEALRHDFDTFKNEISKSVECHGNEIRELTVKTEELETSVNNAWRNVHEHTKQLQGVWEEVNKVERHTRRNNIRLIGVPETVGENVKEIVTDILVTCFGMDQSTEIERAHRDGKKGGNRPRHILIKLLRYQDKVTILRAWRQCLKDKGYRISDDLTRVDLNEKQKWSEEVNDLYSRGMKLRFVGGFWRDKMGKKAPFYTEDPRVTPQKGPYPGVHAAE